jgi:phytoene dehydrogenase-like protein
MQSPVIVVGGGIAGLAAAALVARAGVPVTVLERRREAGGRAATLRVDGYRLTEGAHALYLGGPGYRFLRSLGIDPPGRTPDVSRAKLIRGGELVAAPFGPAQLLTTPLLSVRQRVAAARLLTGLSRRDPQEAAGMTADEWVDARASDPVVREILRSLTRLSTYTGALGELAGEVAVLQLRLTLRENVRYLDGGWGALVDRLLSVGTAAGAEVRTGVTVEAVGEGPAVRLADGSTLTGRAVILAGLSPAGVSRLTGLAVEPPGPPAEAACLDVALTELPCPENAWTLGLDEPFYISAYSQWSRIAPPGGAVVHVVRHLATGEAVGRENLEAALDLVQPGWRERLVHANFLPRMTVVNALAGPGGALRARPATGDLGIPGVELAGDWVGPEGWLTDAVLASAVAAARRALGAPAVETLSAA